MDAQKIRLKRFIIFSGRKKSRLITNFPSSRLNPVSFSFTPRFESQLLSRLRKPTALVFSVLLAWTLSGGPQPFTDAFLKAWGPNSSGQNSLLVELPSDTPPDRQQQILANLETKGASLVIPLGAESPLGAHQAAWSAADPSWTELGVVQGWGGSVRGLSTEFETLPGRIQAALQPNSKAQSLSLPLGAGPPPRVHLEQLDALGTDTVQGRVVVLAPENQWSTHRYATPWGQQSYAELLARFFSGAPLRALLSPVWTVLFVVVLGAFLSKLTPHRKSFALLLPFVVTFILASQGVRFPIEAILGGLLPLAFFGSTHAAPEPVQGPASHPISDENWMYLCEAAQSFTGALAAWAFVQKNNEWVEAAQAGDAGTLDAALIDRLQSSPGSRLPQDRAYRALPVPNPQTMQGLLVLQPRDSTGPNTEPLDPWKVLSGAMTQITTPAPAPISLFQALTGSGKPMIVFDALGQPFLPDGRFQDETGLQCRVDSTLSHTWSTLGGSAADLYDQRNLSKGIQLKFESHAIHLQTGIHAGRVECYILRVAPSCEPPSKAPLKESKC